MKENLQDIDDLFKKSFDDYTEMPSKNVWDNINKNLDNKNLLTLKRRYAVLKNYAAVLLILLISSTCYYYAFNKKAITKPFHSNEVAKNKAADKFSITKIAGKDSSKLIANNDKNINSIEPKSVKTLDNSIPFTESADRLQTAQYDKKISKKPTAANNQINKKGLSTPTFEKLMAIYDKVIDENKLTQINKNNAFTNDENIEAEKNDALNLSRDNKNNSGNNYSKKTLPLVKNETKEKMIADINILPFKPIFVKAVPKFYLAILPGLASTSFKLNKRKTNLHNNKFSATIYASPETAFDRLEDDQVNDDQMRSSINRLPDNRQKIKREEHHSASFSTGILIDYALKNNFSIQSGISFVSKSSETNSKKVFAQKDNDGTIKYLNNCAFGSGFINPTAGTTTQVGDSATADATNNKIMYVGIPLNISYHLKKGKFQISPTVGTSLNFLIKQAMTTGLTDASGTQKQHNNIINGLKSTYINAIVGIDFSYNLSRKISLTLMPVTTLALSAVNQNSMVKSYPNTFGIRGGLKILL